MRWMYGYKVNDTNFHHGAPESKNVVQLINEELADWSRSHAPPGFGWTSLQLNANTVADWRVDYRNLGPSILLAVGDHTGGELKVEGLAPTKLDFKGVLVDGIARCLSWVSAIALWLLLVSVVCTQLPKQWLSRGRLATSRPLGSFWKHGRQTSRW